MKAILIRRTGGPEVLELADVEQPRPRRGEVLVRAAAIGVGWPDVQIRSGRYQWMPALPTSPGSDLAGVVEAIGDGVTQLRVGQKVLISARDLTQRGGCYAEFIAVPEAAPHTLPDNVDLDAAVCLPNYQVAWAMLHDAVGPRPVKSVFITGAAGALGSAAIQLARHAGMAAIGSVSSPEKAAFALSQGATHVVTYKSENEAERVLQLTDGRGVDLVLDHVAGPTVVDKLKMLAPWGTLLSYSALGGLAETDLFRELRRQPARCLAVRAFSIHAYDHEPVRRRQIMAEVIKLLADGAIKPAIGARLPLGDAPLAHAMIEAGASMGKIVLRPDL
jgi:NADPH:quinone reductase